MSNITPVAVGASRLTSAEIDAVARHVRPLTIAAAARSRLDRAYAFARQVAAGDTPVYGLTTGCGPLAGHVVPPERREEFQRNLIRSHAVSLGAAHPAIFVRAAMLTRAHVFAQGYSGVDPAVVDLLVAMLNRGLHPVVREVGSVGASGDLVELAQIALVMTGEGTVEYQGTLYAARAALSTAALDPIVPRLREGLAIMNGTSFHTGAAAVLIARAGRIVSAAQIAAAAVLEALRGNMEAFDPALQRARPHPGQQRVARHISRLTAGSTLARSGATSAGSQDAYTLRCIPQILGTVADILQHAGAVIETEINAVTDNPLFLPDENRVVHGGNFHGQPVAMALDHLKMAMVELGVASERRLARLLDPKLNGGLPAFLIDNGVGLRSGFMGLQYCASSMAADNAVLAAPASVHSVPTNASNQDVVSMGMVAARQAAHVIDNVERMIAIELICAAQALDLRGVEGAGIGTRAAHAAVRAQSAPLDEDRPLADDVDRISRLLESGTLDSEVESALADRL